MITQKQKDQIEYKAKEIYRREYRISYLDASDNIRNIYILISY